MSDPPRRPTPGERSDRPLILVLIEAYLPGWKAGGPIRSLVNMTKELGEQFEFMIITRDRDHTDSAPYPGVPADEWLQVGEAKVLYGSARTLTLKGLAQAIHNVQPDMVFLVGAFSSLTVGYLVLRRLRRIAQIPVLLAVQGQSDQGALALKRVKKRAYLRLARALGLLAGIHWQASSPTELANIKKFFAGASTYVASDIPEAPPSDPTTPLVKRSGSVVLTFISRIAPMKNLPFILEVSRRLKGEITLVIFGPKESGEWEKVERIVKSLPDNVRVDYGGILKHEDVEQALAQAHFFVLPTLGENFGHAIYEALRLARPVIISDRTPWRDLAREGAGWDLPLANRDAWVTTLQWCVDAGNHEYGPLSQAAHAYAQRWHSEAGLASEQAAVFSDVLESRGVHQPKSL